MLRYLVACRQHHSVRRAKKKRTLASPGSMWSGVRSHVEEGRQRWMQGGELDVIRSSNTLWPGVRGRLGAQGKERLLFAARYRPGIRSWARETQAVAQDCRAIRSRIQRSPCNRIGPDAWCNCDYTTLALVKQLPAGIHTIEERSRRSECGVVYRSCNLSDFSYDSV